MILLTPVPLWFVLALIVGQTCLTIALLHILRKR